MLLAAAAMVVFVRGTSEVRPSTNRGIEVSKLLPQEPCDAACKERSAAEDTSQLAGLRKSVHEMNAAGELLAASAAETVHSVHFPVYLMRRW